MQTLEAPTFNNNEQSAPRLMPRETGAVSLQAEVTRKLKLMTHDQRSELAARTHARVVSNGLFLIHDDQQGLVNTPIPYEPIPKLLDKEAMKRHAEDIATVYGVLSRIEEFALAAETTLGKEVYSTVMNGITTEEQSLIVKAKTRHTQTARRRNARADAFFTPSGLSIIEVNNVNPEGIYFHGLMTESALQFLQDTGIETKKLRQKQPDSAALQVRQMLFDEFNERSGGKQPKAIGFISEMDKPEGIINRSELPLLGVLYERISPGLKVINGTPKDVEAANGKMAVNGQEVDVIWRNSIDIPTTVNSAPGMTEVISHPDKYVILNEPTSAIIGSKSTLSFAHDQRVQDAIGMTSKERDAVIRIVPFTFTPNKDTYLGVNGKIMSSYDYLIKYKEYFVLKPSSGTHGEMVHFGVNNNDKWSQAVDHAVSSGLFVAQRYIDYKQSTEVVPSISNDDGTMSEEPRIRDINFHHINGRALATTVSRIVIPVENEDVKTLNVAAGGGLQPTLLV